MLSSRLAAFSSPVVGVAAEVFPILDIIGPDTKAPLTDSIVAEMATITVVAAKLSVMYGIVLTAPVVVIDVGRWGLSFLVKGNRASA